MKIGHDLKWMQLALSHYNIELRGELFDTMIAHYVIQPELRHHLSYISEIYLHHTGLSLEGYFGVRWMEERNMRLLPEEMKVRFQS